MPRVALVVLDTLRYDAFDAHFDWLPGKRFEHAYSPSHRTPPVHAAMFCGKYASELGVYAGADALDCPEPTLAESLSAAGVRTRAFSANTYITEHFGFDRGFDEFERPWQLDSLDDDVFDWQAHVDDSRFDPPLSYLSGVAHCLVGEKRTRRSLRDAAKRFSARQGWFGLGDDGAEECLAYLRDTEFEDDEFVFCNLMEAHEPYEPPEAYRTTDLEWLPTTAEIALGETSYDPETVRQAYHDSVRYLADRYEEIFAVLDDQFDYVITCADHGELFDRDGLWGHFYGVYPELTRVPLIISGADVDATDCEAVVSLLDVHRTVADLFDVDVESRGRSLLGNVEGRSYLTESHGIAEKRLDAVRSEAQRQRARRYRQPLTGFATPPSYYGYETPAEFVETGTAVVDVPYDRMVSLRDSLDTPSEESAEGEMSESVQSRLEDLGYV
ncbi:sulfatase-like hydrolase/transferase [Haloplanus litoreus]|uniref:sulfatase-like hydrolase/transferase n=1 Tax=Haloplanus litoreus TaxID=767515 RepID=UPI0036417A63